MQDVHSATWKDQTGSWSTNKATKDNLTHFLELPTSSFKLQFFDSRADHKYARISLTSKNRNQIRCYAIVTRFFLCFSVFIDHSTQFRMIKYLEAFHALQEIDFVSHQSSFDGKNCDQIMLGRNVVYC